MPDHPDDVTQPSRLARAIARLATRRPATVLLVGLAVAVLGFGLASQLSLQTDLAELLPQNARSVILLRQLDKRVGGTGNVAIALEGEVPALRAYMPVLVEALKKDLGKDLLLVKYQRKDVDDFFKRFAAYYVPIADLQRWQEQLAERVARTVNPLLVDLDEPAPAPAASQQNNVAPHKDELHQVLDELRDARDKVMPKNEADPETGLLIRTHQKPPVAVVFVRPAANSLHLAGSKGMLDRIKGIVASTHPGEKGVTIAGYTGSIPSALTEVDAVKRDIAATALLVVLLVGGVVVVYFRGFKEIFLLSGALAVGAAVALGFAYLWIGHVNAQTAFLGSIIVGTGINYGIIFLDRWRRLRARAAVQQKGAPQTPDEFEATLAEACEQTLRATWIAALATGVSFGVLAAGEVESFRQFGWMGGLGILACWVATFTLVPASVTLVDRRRAPRPLPRHAPLDRTLELVGAGAARAPWLVLLLCGAATVASGFLAVKASREERIVESDMRNLSTRSSATKGIEKIDNKLRAMDDRSSTPAVVATDSRDDAAGVCEVLNRRAKTDLKGVVRGCHSIADLLPTDVAERKPLLDAIHDDLDKVDTSDLKGDDKQLYDDLAAALQQRPPVDSDLPPTQLDYFVEKDGSIGKLAFVDPMNDHLEKNLYAFSDAMRHIELPSGKVIESSGENVVFADVLRAMRRDAKKLTTAAAILVLLVLGIVVRRFGSWLRVGGSLCIGVALMCGVALSLGQKLNFFNFVALPTTFGIGIDYAINIEERLRQRGAAGNWRKIARATREGGPAVMLASLTSILGYASLLTADSRALSSFGQLAIVGEVTCVAVAVMLVPALWSLARARRQATAETADAAAAAAAAGGGTA